MDCKRASEMMFLFCDNEMGDDVVSPFRRHLNGCGHCSQRMDYTRKFLLLLRSRCTRHSAPDHLRERILGSLGQPGPGPRELH
ncbi:MAG TPA: zf-HC2 domain-containing protein [Longimicrobiaceae bacterium]|nr:zf-HC2 domain-containing protein [Longimicrobiaceae bacterium]